MRNNHKLAPFCPFKRLLRVARFGLPLPFGGWIVHIDLFLAIASFTPPAGKCITGLL